MRHLRLAAFAGLLGLAPSAYAQSVTVTRDNRTIEVIATEKIRVLADIANVTIGCISYGQTHDQAFQTNADLADKVVKAILEAGVQKSQIESDSVELGEADSGDNADQSASVRKNRQFKAHQSWRLRLAASDAQKIIDVAVRAGANGIEYVSWDVADPDTLEAQARSAAMEKGRASADELAKSSGGKRGSLLYVSNTVNGILGLLAGQGALSTTSASVGAAGKGQAAPRFSFQLFPEKVERQATIRAIYALE